jgi:hypothetical protein
VLVERTAGGDGDLVPLEPADGGLFDREAADGPRSVARRQQTGVKLFHQYPGKLL